MLGMQEHLENYSKNIPEGIILFIDQKNQNGELKYEHKHKIIFNSVMSCCMLSCMPHCNVHCFLSSPHVWVGGPVSCL